MAVQPVLTLSATDTVICDGDSVWLTCSPDYPSTFLWSTGATTATIGVDSAKTYTVVATNCGGTTIDSITVGLPPAPTASVTGDEPFCMGDTITLAAGTESGATYSWSTGDSTQSIMVDTAMAITLIVTNCAGADTLIINTEYQASPTVIMDVNGQTTFCDDGGTSSLALTAFPNGGLPFTYLWSNASTQMSITLSDASE